LFEAIWNNYNPELSKVFLANWKGRSVSGVFVVVQGKTVYALNAGSLVEGWEVRPNDIMHWKVMEWACANGYLKYNLGGVSEPPPAERSSSWGIWRWKREWNGNLERIEIFDKIILPKYKPILQARNFVYEGLRQLK
jgi:lipid II:glycine glycyltransferase (peptidoglycan interpeptide bridge formation enzyme)